jgi:hypothetical protein
MGMRRTPLFSRAWQNVAVSASVLTSDIIKANDAKDPWITSPACAIYATDC